MCDVSIFQTVYFFFYNIVYFFGVKFYIMQKKKVASEVSSVVEAKTESKKK